MSETILSVKLSEIVKDFNLDTIFAPDGWSDISIQTAEVNRPGLQIFGFFQHFDNTRIQLLGIVEFEYLKTLNEEQRFERFNNLFASKIPAAIVTTSLTPFPEMIEAAKNNSMPLFSTKDTTSDFMAGLIANLNLKLAERITRHGVLIECYGEGILLLGESGVGKSETAMELLKRGHRLIADDAVEIKKVSNKTLVGTSPEIIRHLMELRGIGIVDVRRIFGMGAVKESEKIDLVINLEIWDEDTHYDRFGLDEQFTEILGLKITSLKIPVKPGRNLAIIIEIAAMNNRLKKMGYNSAQEFNKRLMQDYEDQIKL